MNKKVLTLCAGFLLAGGMLNTVSAHLGNMVEGQYYRIDVVGAGQDAGAYSLDSDNQDATGWWCNSDAVSYDFDGSAWWTIEPVKDPVKGDVIAYDMPVLLRRKILFRYCGPETVTHQVLVQRRDTSKLSKVPELIGKVVYVEKGSKYELRTQNLGKELGGKITMKYALNDTATSIDEFIDAVAKGKIDYTIADNLTASLYKGFYKNLDISMNVSFEQRSAWLVMKKNSELADSIDSWTLKNNLEKKYLSTMRKYFRMSKLGNNSVSTYGSAISLKDGIISPYDNLFKQYAATIGWDWKLLAAIAYSESKFDSTLVSWAGAKGIMQLMPQTAKGFSDEGWDTNSNEHNIAAACRYIASLERSFAGRVKDRDERLKFIIASYNSGIGHVRGFQRCGDFGICG